MRRNSIFWAVVLVTLGLLMLLRNLGWLRADVWGLIWPILLIALGVWILWRALSASAPDAVVEEVVIPLEGATRGEVRVHHGAGRLRVAGGAAEDKLLVGTFGGGVRHHIRRVDEALQVTLELPHEGGLWLPPWQWGPGGALDWNFSLNPNLPLTLRFETGVGEAFLDLTGLKVSDVEIRTGASTTTLLLPANAGYTCVRIEGGATSVNVRVPQGVAARIQAEAGLAGIAVDQGRFPRVGSFYQSPDYETATNRVEISAHMGAASLDVR